MPLPPLGIDRYREWAASRWRDATDATISRVRSGLWDMQAEDAISRLRPLELPEPEPIYQPPEPAYEPPPPPPPPPSLPPPESPLQALSGGIGSTLSGIGQRASSALSGARGALTGGVQAAQQTAGGWAAQADAAIDGIGDAIGASAQAALPRVVPDATQPGGERVELGGLTRYMPLPPALEGLRPGLEGYGEDVATAGRFVAQRPGEVASAVDTAAGFMPGRFLTRTLPRVARGEGPRVLGELGEALPALGAAGTLAPIPAWQAGNLVANVVEEPLLRAGVNPALAGAAGLAADVLTPDPGTAARVAGRAPGVLEGLGRVADDLPYRFGRAAEAVTDDAALGIRRGQRLRMPAVTPEQQAQRLRDEAAEKRMFEAMMTLQRRGLSEQADDLRLYALGKGESGEGYARSMLGSAGLRDVYPRPTVDLPNAPGFEDAARIDALRSGPGTLVSQGGRTLGPDDVVEVYHATSPETAAALVTRGVQPGGKVRRGRTVIESEQVAQMLGKRVGDVLDYEPGAGIGEGLYVGATPEALSQYGDAVVGVRVRVRDLLTPPERRVGSPAGAVLKDDGYLERAIDPADIRLVSGGTGTVTPGGVGITEGAPAGDGLLGLARRATEPLMARGAMTPGERAFDVAAGTAGGMAGAATADEDATWQERLGRGALGASLGALGGANVRQLGRLGQRALGEGDVLGVAAGRATRDPSARSIGGVTAADIPEVIASIPLAAPSSLGVNLVSGLARSTERVVGKAFELRPFEAAADLAAMVRELPGATGRLRRSYRGGPTAETPGLTGEAAKEGLIKRPGKLAGAITVGTRANSATDQFWRDLNEAGAAGAAAYRRKVWGQPVRNAQEAQMRASAGDFATFAGPNSRLARALTDLKKTVHDPDADFADKAIAWGVTSSAPYVLMPERLLRATVGALIPVESAVGATRAFLKGDRVAARELAGRAAAGVAATTLLTHMYLDGAITGDAPEDANERRRREAQGEQWNTIAVPGGGRISTRWLGSFGMQADAVATTLDTARKAQQEGGDPGAVLEKGVNGAAKWLLDESYLSDLQDFGEQVGKGNFTGGLRSLAAGQPSRFTSPVTGIINAADPYEREATTFPEMVASRTGLRSLVPARIDPVTGEEQRRAGTGLSRYFGERGAATTDEGGELARAGLQPRVLGKNEEYAGAKQTPEARRAIQRVLGSETGKAVRETTASQEYRAAAEAEKKQLLERALRQAAAEAELRLGDGITRGPRQQADWEYDAVPHFQGIKKDAPAEEVRRYNRDVAAAKRARTEARKKYPKAPDKGQSEWARANPEQNRLANRGEADATSLKKRREEIDQKYGVKR